MGCGCECGNNDCSWIYDCCCCPVCMCGCMSVTSGETCLNNATYYLINSEVTSYVSLSFSEVIFVPDGSSQSANDAIEQFMRSYYAAEDTTWVFGQTTPPAGYTNGNTGCVDTAKNAYMWQNNLQYDFNDDIFTWNNLCTPYSCPPNGCIYTG